MEAIDQIQGTTQQQNELIAEQKQFALVGDEYSLIPPPAATAATDATTAATPLWEEVSGNATFEAKYRWLGAARATTTGSSVHGSLPPPTFASYRPVRRDGSCFYRSALFQIFHMIAMEVNGCYASSSPSPSSASVPPPPSMATALRMLLVVGQWKEDLKKYFGDFVEDFVEVAEEVTKKAMGIRVAAPMMRSTASSSSSDVIDFMAWRKLIGDEVAKLLNNEADSTFEYIVCLARYGVSSFLRDNASCFAPFIGHIVDLGDDDLSIATFCEREVDVVGGECDEVHLLAFSAFFKVNLTIAMMDNNTTAAATAAGGSSSSSPCELKTIQFHDTIVGLCGKALSEEGGEAAKGLTGLGPFADVPLYLLYRPGHYEILQPLIV